VLTHDQVPERLSSWAANSPVLSAWLARFSSLRRPLDACMPLAEVLMAAGDVVSGILTAKGAAKAAQAAAEAAKQAWASAEKVSMHDRGSSTLGQHREHDVPSTRCFLPATALLAAWQAHASQPGSFLMAIQDMHWGDWGSCS